jgi:hypothetical protein
MGESVDKAVRDWCQDRSYRWSPQNWISGGICDKFQRPSTLSVTKLFKDMNNKEWAFNIEGASIEDNQNLPPEESVPQEPATQAPEEPSDEQLVDTGDLPWINPEDRGIVTTPHYDFPTSAADMTDGADFRPRSKEQPFTLKFTTNGGRIQGG